MLVYLFNNFGGWNTDLTENYIQIFLKYFNRLKIRFFFLCPNILSANLPSYYERHYCAHQHQLKETGDLLIKLNNI